MKGWLGWPDAAFSHPTSEVTTPQGAKQSALEPSLRRLPTTSSCKTTLAAGNSLGQGLLLQCALPRARGLLQQTDCIGHADPWG